MATTININISGYGVKTTTESSDTRHLLEYSERQWQEDNFYTLLPGFSPVGYLHGERKLKKKKKKNCSNGQVCGFSCISKTKTCIANMTTAQLKEHNKAKRLAAAEKRKAAKAAKAGGAGGASQPNKPGREVGDNTVVPNLIDIVDMNVSGADEDRAKRIANQYLQGQVPLRPVFVKSAGIDKEEFVEKFDVVDRQDEARAFQIARSQNKDFSLAQVVKVTPENEAFIKEQMDILSPYRREIPEIDPKTPKSEPFDSTKRPQNPRLRFDVDSVKGDDPELDVGQFKAVEALAQNYLKGGNIDPIIIRRAGIDKERGEDNYEVVSGKLEFAALRRARQLDPLFDKFSGIVMDDSNARNIVEQLKALDD